MNVTTAITNPELLTLEQAIELQLDIIAERERQREVDEQARQAEIEAGRRIFAAAICDYAATEIGVALDVAQIVQFVEGQGGGYRLYMPVEAEPRHEWHRNTQVVGLVTMAHMLTLSSIRYAMPQWIGVRRYYPLVANVDVDDADDIERYETKDLIAAITFAKTGKR